MQIQLTKFVILLCAMEQLRTIKAGHHLAEKPHFLVPCHLGDANFNQCFAKNFQGTFTEWGGNVPGLKSAGSLDPIHVKRIHIQQSGGQTVNIDAELVDVYGVGASRAIIKEASFDPSTYLARMNVLVPHMSFKFDYTVKGRVAILNLNSHGKGIIETENANVVVDIRMKPRVDGGHVFTDIDFIHCTFKSVSKMHVQLDNIFNGEKSLEEAANSLFNENWRTFYGELRPTLEQTFDKILLNRFKKIFAYVPADYFIDNLI